MEMTLTLETTIDTAYRVLERLEGVQTCRAGWQATCPCCGTAGALTVGLDDFAWAFVGLTCAAGCEPARICAAVGLPAPQRWRM